MFSPACLSLSPLKLVGHKTSGSYDIDQLPADGLDQNLNKVDENNNNSSSSSSNNNNNNNNGQLDPSTLVPANQHFQTSQRDFNQNQARRLKKLRSISFSRFVYLKSHYSYDLPRQLTELKSPQTSQYTEIESKSIKSKLLPNNNNNLNDQKDGVTLCSLGVGTTFGASVMPGKSHSVSVVTNEECTLLRVRRADFQEIFNGQSHLINDLEASPFLPFGSLHGHNNNKQQAGDLGALTRIRSSISSSLSKFAPGGRHSQSACHGQSGRQGRAQTPVARDAANPAGSYQRRRSSLISGAAQSGAPEQPQPASRRQSVTMSSRQAYELADSAQSTRATPRSIPYGGHQAAASQQPQQVASYSVEEAPHKRDTGGGDLESQEHEPNEDAADQTQAELEAEDLNLDSLEADELTSHLMKVGWVLRTLILSEAAHMIKSRRVYPQLHHALLTSHSANVSTAAPHQSSSNIAGAKLSNKQQRQQQPTPSQGSQPAAPSRSSALRTSMGRHLVSMGSSSQLFLSSTASSASSSTKSVASSAGRKVANYVASSFMRTSGGGGGGGGSGGSPSSQQIPTIGATSTTPTGHSNLSVLLLSSKQTVPTDQPTGGRHPDSKLHHFSSLDQNNNNNNNNTNVISQPVSEHKSKAQVANHHHHHHHSLHEHQEQPVQLEHSLVGREMVDWLLQLSSGSNTNAGRFVGSRLQAVSMWQVLLEQEAILSVPLAPGSGSSGGGKTSAKPESYQKHQQQQQQQQSQRQAAHQFRDNSHAYYKFWFDCESDLEGSQEDQQASREQKPEAPATSRPPLPRPRDSEEALANEALWWSLKLLSKLAPDACFRLILGKQPHERTLEEVDIVFEELQHLKALSHLTNSVKKQLAACVQSEHHARQNTVVFNQGDPGQSWYIILRGSVNVVIVGKGVVCTLHDGDDFGKLALVNDAPRAATIVTNEPNCYFLRVDKRDFNTILRDVEANTVRLKEHGKEVLILQKVAIKEQQLSTPEQLQQQQQQQAEQQQQQGQSQLGSSSEMIAAQTAVLDGGGQPGGGPSASGAGSAAAPTASQLQQAGACALKYMVMAGTAEKMLEHLLETRIDGQTQTAPLPLAKAALFQHDQMANYIQCHGDNFLEDFILTHKIFMPTGNLCQELLRQYQQSGQAAGSSSSNSKASTPTPPTSSGGGPGQANAATSKQQPALDDEYLVAKKRRVIKFVRFWMLINREHFFQQQQIQTFVMTLHQRVKLDAQRFSSLQPELKAISRIYELQLEENLESRHRGCQRWIEDLYGNILPIRRHSGSWQAPTSSGGGGGQTGTSLPASSNPTNEQQQMAASEHFLASLHQRRFQHKLSTIQPEDELVFRVYCADHTFTTLKCRFDEQAGQIKQVAARNLKLEDKELILVHVKSNGERIIYNDLETNICTCLSVNGRLFVCPLDHIDAISPLPEQDPFQEVYQSLASIKQQQTSLDGAENTSGGQVGAALAGNAQQQQQQQQQPPHQSPLANSNLSSASQQSQTQSQPDLQPISSHLLVSTPSSFSDIKLQMSLSVSKLEEFSSRDIAYCLTQLAWSLLKNMHEFELVYTVFGQHNFKQNTANLNVFLRHFNEIQYWVVTQICLSSSLSKRVQILRKFIKIAAHCKELQNLNAFFAIIMGLSNMAVARLTQTWERLPNKLKRTFSQFESQIDPSRNHRRYRIFLSKLEPPIVPFMPLFLKDMTFAHEGNKTHLENGLINFEKMQMIAQTLRTVRYCKSRAMKLDASACKFKSSIRSIELFFRDLKIIDNQRTLTQMSHQLEHRKT